MKMCKHCSRRMILTSVFSVDMLNLPGPLMSQTGTSLSIAFGFIMCSFLFDQVFIREFSNPI